MSKRKSGAKAVERQLEKRFAGWDEKARRQAQEPAGQKVSSGPSAGRGEEARRPERHFVTVSYDIPDDRRRNRVCKLLKDYGERVQYSVFECSLRPDDFKRLRERLKPLLVPEDDDVRFYRLCESCRRRATVWSARKRRQWEKAVVV